MRLFEANNGEGTRELGEIEISALSRISHKKDARKNPKNSWYEKKIYLGGKTETFSKILGMRKQGGGDGNYWKFFGTRIVYPHKCEKSMCGTRT